ncbi:type I-E CRISPR-associated protein Cas5/CasD [Deinococcus soli (ex Cha et al. 2016)]|uniref:CRISPR-associated protein Cas5/CasD subtype I-E n=2 Tax=Deinococcus soli (ex Cha et al. 2016) TaxID=1309411 RepID=A0AAE3XCL0_9DEIO|nr:type I-E CRISPR-associated protein Cas5/CasD [Deinococcus soli (ex Cha et al. 2016)]MDR6218922.1 CRISPR-associated protein Cas5/CasD subtype I-E [Deinococcus soli (ex Cha et al. 2016)]MDR6328719.1 CRISPR-associated protein Cas5/CasD subtype I-E [Deinococcus soli (ex Cha et al. 2016)]MDR6751794.1 CRISPR-associated protein Cas5/CasD subtype I-E [Deinococcus soli (ex Cha et al. 2016)]
MTVPHGTVLLRLCGPLSAWGDQGRNDIRATRSEPTLSGVVGLVASAMGRDWQDDVSDLTSLEFGVRVDRPGDRLTDYHTAQERDGRDPQRFTGETGVTRREYLQDLRAWAALRGPLAVIEQIDAAVRHPARPVWLGRRSCPPGVPIAHAVVPDQQQASPLVAALLSAPRLLDRPAGLAVTMTVDRSAFPAGTEPPLAQPVWAQDRLLGTFADRQFGLRAALHYPAQVGAEVPLDVTLWVPGPLEMAAAPALMATEARAIVASAQRAALSAVAGPSLAPAYAGVTLAQFTEDV